jgi:hypothetical protein
LIPVPQIPGTDLDSRVISNYLCEEDFHMSEKIKNALLRLQQEMKENEAEVRELFNRAGIKPDPALLSSVLKYHKALKKLAAK